MENPRALTWGELPCNVPGYDTTAASYAGMIQEHFAAGDFILALHYLRAAEKANVLGRIEAAACEIIEARKAVG